MNGPGSGPRYISSRPERAVEPARADGGAEVTWGDIGGDDAGRGPLHERHIVRAERLVEGVGQVHDAALDCKCASERLEAGVAEIGVLEARQGAARKESDGRSGDAGGAGKSVRRAAEVVDQGEIPIAQNF